MIIPFFATQVQWLLVASTRMAPPSSYASPIPSYANCFPACPSSTCFGHQVILPQVQDSTFPTVELHNILFHPSTISSVHQPSWGYLQSLLRVHSVLSYGSVLRALRNIRPSTEPWRALPGTGLCHWSQPSQPRSFSSTSKPIKPTLHQLFKYDVMWDSWNQQHPQLSPHPRVSHLIAETSRVHQAWFPLLLFFRILNSTISRPRLLPTPTFSSSLCF